MVNRPKAIQKTVYLEKGECPECKAWKTSGEYDGHADLIDGVCPKCGGEYHV